MLVGHQVFRELVQDSGWSVPEYKAWLFRTLVQQLLPPPQLKARAVNDPPTSSRGHNRHPVGGSHAGEPVVVGDHHLKFVLQYECGRQVDGIERP